MISWQRFTAFFRTPVGPPTSSNPTPVAKKESIEFPVPVGNPPSVKLSAFSCPHCGAYTAQRWFSSFANAIGNDQKTPFIPDEEDLQKMLNREKEVEAKLVEVHRSHILWVRRMLRGLPFLQKLADSRYVSYEVENLHLSECFTCSKVALWVYGSLLYPPRRTGPTPNADIPEDILRDFEEASTILALSPRGAAALLRLAIEKLCIHIGAEGKDINQQIAWLVRKGLPEKLQRALDAVRVIGNEAVHPGQLDLRDDRDTSLELFDLVNIISDEMISRPNRIESVYGKIPPTKKAGIAQRDAKPPTALP